GALVVCTAIIEDQIDGAGLRIDGHPLEELVIAVVDEIVVHAYLRAPTPAVVGRRRDKDVDIAVGVVAPGNVQLAALGPRINSDLGEAVRTGDAGDAKIPGTGGNDAALFGEGGATIAGDSHHDSFARIPDRVQCAIRPNHAVKALQRAVVVTGQAGNAAELDG